MAKCSHCNGTHLLNAPDMYHYVCRICQSVYVRNQHDLIAEKAPCGHRFIDSMTAGFILQVPCVTCMHFVALPLNYYHAWGVVGQYVRLNPRTHTNIYSDRLNVIGTISKIDSFYQHKFDAFGAETSFKVFGCVIAWQDDHVDSQPIFESELLFAVPRW